MDFTEVDFTQKLMDQINGELSQAPSITEEKFVEVAKKRSLVLDDFYAKRFINRRMNIKADIRYELFAEYSEFAIGLESGKVEDRNKEKSKSVKIRRVACMKYKNFGKE